MTAHIDAHDGKLAVLGQLLASATHDASAAMRRWTDGLITLTLDEVRQVSLEEACVEFSLGEEMLTMVVLGLEGDLGGAMIIAFDDLNGRRLAASLLGRTFDPLSPWSELEKSALMETGNILGCAYLSAITRLIGRQLVPTPPQFLRDWGDSVLQQALLIQAAADEVMVFRTAFHRQREELQWRVLFVPTPALREAMETSLPDVP